MTRLTWLMLLAISSLYACGGSLADTMRRTTYVAAEALRESDRLAASEFNKAHARALSDSQTLDEYRRRMEDWHELHTLLRAAHLALLGVEAGIDIFEANGNKSEWRRALACASDVFDELYSRFEDLVPEAPDALIDAIALFKGDEGACNEGR